MASMFDLLPNAATNPGGFAEALEKYAVLGTVDPTTNQFTLTATRQDGGVASVVVGGDARYIPSGTVSADTLVAWTPALSTARMWYAAEDAQNQAGNLAANGEAVYKIPNRIASTSRTDSQIMPLVPKGAALAAGIAANAPQKRLAALNGYNPVSFGTIISGGSTNRLSTQAGAISPPTVHRIFMVAAMRGTAFPYLMSVHNVAGNSLVSGNATRQLRAGTDSQIFGTFTDSTPFLLSYERGGTEQLFESGVAVSSVYARLNGVQTASNTAAASGLSNDVAFAIGNRGDTDVATDMDFWECIVVEGHMTQADIYRMEGYLAHKYTLQANLPGDHPYRSTPPQVPAGTTTQAGWEVHAYPWGYRQTVQGYHFELADDNIAANDGAQGTDQSRAILYDLKPSERARLAALLKGAYSIRFALGIYYRGSRSINGTSLLSDTIGPRLPAQRQHLFELIRDAGITGIAPEYWSPAPHWKTTSSFAGGVLWAGAAYSRATTLDSIRVSDATQYNAQIAAFTNAVISDLEDLHSHDTYPMRVVAFGLQNEPLGSDASYGSCLYTPQLYVDIMKVLVPKIRNSTKLSTWGGSPNTVQIHADSWGGPSDTIATAIVADATVLSTGKTLLQELAYWTHHRIGEQNGNADITLTGNGTTSDNTGQPYYNFRLAATNPSGIACACNEYEFFSDLGKPAQFANLVQTWINHLNWTKAPLVTLIHAGKPSTDTVAPRYALTSWRVPGDAGAPADPLVAPDYSEFGVNDACYNAAKPFILWLKSSQWLLTQEAAYNPSQKVGAFFASNGKLVVILLNASATAAQMSVSIGAQARQMRGYLYSATVKDQALSAGATQSNRLSASVPAKSMQIYFEV